MSGHTKRRYRPPIAPIGGDLPVHDWDQIPGGRDGFVLMVSQTVDACAQLGYDSPYDGPQIAAWLESPDVNDRRRASFHLATLRNTLEQGTRSRRRGGVS